MGRFNHLEMTDPWPEPAGAGHGPQADLIDEQSYADRADACFAREDFERALSYYSRSLQYDAGIPHAWAGQIRCLIELNELPEAVTWSERALERFPQSAEILAARAVAEGRSGRTEQAMGFADSALKLPDVVPYVWVARGDVLISVHQANAKACFLKAVELAPHDGEVCVWIGRAYCFRHRWHQALTHLRDAVTREPEHATAWFWVGRCCEELGDTQEANRAYRRVLAIESGHKGAREGIYRLEHSSIFSKLSRSVRRRFGGR